MKNFKIKYLFHFLLFTSLVTSIISCSDDDSSSQGIPVINSVSAAVDINGNPVELTPTTVGYADNVYIIQGSGFATVQKVFFNDTDTYFNPTLATDNTIILTIDRDTPYADASNQLRVETLNGTATFDFVVAPPAPLVTSFNSINAADGDTVTIYGSFFLDPTVTFGTTPATVISNTLTEIQVIVPPGSFHKYVTVTTISGSSTSTQAVGTAIYDDVVTSLCTYTGAWSGTPNYAFTDDKLQGLQSIRHAFPGFSGLQFDLANINSTPFKGVRVSIKATKEAKVQIIMNGNFNPAGYPNLLDLTTEWKSFYIPFADFGFSTTPSTISQITFQEWGATGEPAGNVLLIDDLGLVLN